MAKPNYAFAKRQRDLAKKQKKEEKRLRKAETSTAGPATAENPDGDAAVGVDGGEPTGAPAQGEQPPKD